MHVDSAAALDLEAVLARVREIVEDVIAPNASAVDEQARWPEEGVRALQAAGLAGLVVPQAYGGLGFGLLGLVRVCEEIGKACCSSALCFGMHCVGSAVLSAKATPHHARRYLEPIVRGEHWTTLALSEPGTGAHFYFPETELERVSAEAFCLRGVKSFITNGGHADSYVVSTVAVGPGRPAGEFSTVVVQADTEGLRWGEPWNGIGMRGNSGRRLDLPGVQIPAADLLGEEGDQIWYIFNVVAPYFLASMSGTYLGAASAALDQARAHLKRRLYGHSGAALSQVAVLQHRLGSLWSVVERTRQFAYYAAAESDAGGPAAVPALCSAKAEVAEAAVETVNGVMTLMGGQGYRENGLLGRLLRDVRAADVMAPTTDILRTWTGRILLDMPILGE